MLKTLKQRDRKETRIDIAYEHVRLNKETAIRIENDLQKMIDDYQKWKTENKIEGIKY
jgi:hypothetical protein